MQIKDRVKGFERVRAKDLIPNESNWRVHGKEQTSALKGLLSEIGFAGAILVRPLPDGKFQIIDGHLRAKTAPHMMVPVLVTDLSEEEAQKVLLTFDPISAMADADKSKLDALLASAHFENPNLQALLERLAGMDAAKLLLAKPTLTDPPAQFDKAAELAKKWGTAAGQCWRAGDHRLTIGDCRTEGDTAALWGKAAPKIRLIWSDPPYGVNYAGKNKMLNRSDRGNRIQKPIVGDKNIDVHALFYDALVLASRRCERGASLYVTVPGGPLITGFMEAMTRAGFGFRHSLVWVKNQFVIGMSDYHYRHEPILYGWLESGAHYFTEDRGQSSVFEVDKPQVSDHHPTTKPVELVAKMIANSTRPGELVYDPFCGSGSTLLAAHQLGRVGYGVEIDPDYAAVSLERLTDLGLEPELKE